MNTPPQNPHPNTPAPLFQNAFTKSSRIIHTPSPFARASLIYLQEVGSLQALAPHVASRENLASYLFFLVREGEGSLTYEGTDYALHAGDCAFIDCRKGYSQSSSFHQNEEGRYDALWALSWVHFSGPTMDSVYKKYKERGGRPVFHCRTDHGEDRAEQYEDYLRSIFAAAASASYVRDMQIAEKLTSLLALLMEDAWNPDASSLSASKRISIEEIKTYIETHFQDHLTLESLANQFFINKHYLAKRFKEQYGFPVNAYILHVRIGKAKELLRFSSLTIERIAYECGFSDANYFARSFKKIEGLSPSRYRESW